MSERELVSLEIRPGVYVRFWGLPWDLTPPEAAKIAGVVRALADAPSGVTATGRELGPGKPKTTSLTKQGDELTRPTG